MVKHVWPLVFFTILAQIAAGGYLLLKISRVIPALAPLPESGAKRMITVLLIIASAALLISFSHLGSPRNAVFALCNFRTSWLSREVFFMAAFTGILLFETVLFKWIHNSNILSVVVSIFGILILVSLVYSMSRIYQLETVPAWNKSYTLLNFFNTALLAGTFLLIFFSPLKSEVNINSLLMAEVVFLIVQMVLLVGFSPATGGWKTAAIILYGLVLLTTKLEIIKVIPQTGLWGLILVTLLLFAIFTERYLFYVAYRNIGV